MTAKKPHTIPVPGSERSVIPHARKIGAADPATRLQVTVMVRRRQAAAETLGTHLMQGGPGRDQALTTEEFAERFGADSADLDRVSSFAHEHGLEVVDSKPAERRLLLTGTVAAFSAAFGVALDSYATDAPTGAGSGGNGDVDSGDGGSGASGSGDGGSGDGGSGAGGSSACQYRGRSGPVHIPAALADVVEGVFGLDDRPQARPHFRLLPPGAAIQAHAATVAYTPPQLAAAYAFPSAGKGHGQCIAIIELGGGYRPAELKAYFNGLGISPPVVKSRSVDGGNNHPDGNANSADGEVLLDIEVAGAIAPASTIVVYFAPNTDAGFLDAVSSAIHDQQNRPSVLSISWGGPESSWTGQAMRAMDAVFQDAAALGVTVCCAAGDDGSSDQRMPAADYGLLHADFPASSPFALACGGTRLQSAVPRQETVWNGGRSGGATGGGVSEVFARPVWQDSVKVPASANPGHHVGRGLPDVSANADPATGYMIQVDGQRMVFGGTSAVAPLYAALIALCNEQLGRRLGYLNPLLYRLPASAQAFNDIRGGDNDISGHHGPYAANAGWDACTGLGSVHGVNLLAALGQR